MFFIVGLFLFNGKAIGQLIKTLQLSFPIPPSGGGFGVNDGPLFDLVGNIYFAGSEVSDSSMFIVKCDPLGNLIWKRYYNRPNSMGYQSPSKMLMDSNGDLIISVQDLTYTADFDVTLLKYDQQGNQLWQYTYTAPGADHAGDFVLDLFGNSFLCIMGNCGQTMYNPLHLVKVDASGQLVYDVLLNTQYGGYGFDHLVLAPGGNIYVHSTNWDSVNLFHNKIYYCDSLFNPIWIKDFTNFGIGAMNVDTAGNIVMAGNTNPINYSGILRIDKYNSQGNLIWTQSHGSLGSQIWCSDLLIDNIGCIYFNFNNNTSSTPNGFTLKFDSNGNLKWSYQVPNPGWQYEYAVYLKWLSDGTLISTEMREVGGSIGWWNIFDLVQLDTAGNVLGFTSKSYPYQQGQLAVGRTFENSNTGELGVLSMFPNQGNFELTKICRGGNCQPNIAGTVYLDANNDCIPDTNETKLSGKIISVNNGQDYAMTDTSGKYYLQNPPGNYSLSETLPMYWYETCPGPVIATLTSVNDSSMQNNFGNQFPPNLKDLFVYTMTSDASPGFSQYHLIYFGNHGTTTESGNVAINLDPIFNFISASPAPDSINGQQLIWNFSNLAPLAESNIVLTTSISNSVLANTLYVNNATITSPGNDYFPNDNISLDSGMVTSSFDPNYKAVIPSGIIEKQDSLLTYSIYFQNTGNDTAKKVCIVDTLSTYLDLSTFKILCFSHEVSAELFNGHTIRFTFSNIMLPDSSTNEVLSHGFIRFSIQQKKNIPQGTVISNVAYIYFDFNAPVVTNYVLDTLATHAIDFYYPFSTPVGIYPNPASDNVFVLINDYSGEISMELTDAAGRIVERQFVVYQAQSTSLDMSQLNPGYYLLHVKGVDLDQTVKVVRVKN